MPLRHKQYFLMADIVHLDTYKTRAMEERGFGPWQKRFGEIYTVQTRFSDLSPKTLYTLALPGEEGNTAFYELIMGILDLGKAAKFYYLEKKEQLQILDIHLFLADTARFELMRRLGWIESYPCETCPLAAMVTAFDRLRDRRDDPLLTLSRSHPDYTEYLTLTSGDRESFIRRMLPEALELFHEKIPR